MNNVRFNELWMYAWVMMCGRICYANSFHVLISRRCGGGADVTRQDAARSTGTWTLKWTPGETNSVGVVSCSGDLCDITDHVGAVSCSGDLCDITLQILSFFFSKCLSSLFPQQHQILPWIFYWNCTGLLNVVLDSKTPIKHDVSCSNKAGWQRRSLPPPTLCHIAITAEML